MLSHSLAIDPLEWAAVSSLFRCAQRAVWEAERGCYYWVPLCFPKTVCSVRLFSLSIQALASVIKIFIYLIWKSCSCGSQMTLNRGVRKRLSWWRQKRIQEAIVSRVAGENDMKYLYDLSHCDTSSLHDNKIRVFIKWGRRGEGGSRSYYRFAKKPLPRHTSLLKRRV